MDDNAARGAVFSDWQTGVRFLRDLYSAGMTPAACRLVDNDQFRFGREVAACPSPGVVSGGASAEMSVLVLMVALLRGW